MEKLIVVKDACPVMLEFVQQWAFDLEGLPARERLLEAALALLPGSRAAPEIERARSLMALDWMVRGPAPDLMELTPSLASHAQALRALPQLDGPEAAERSKQLLNEATAAASAAERPSEGMASARGNLTMRHSGALAAGYSVNVSAGATGPWCAATQAALQAAWQAATAAASQTDDSGLPQATSRAQEGAIELLSRMSALRASDPLPADPSVFLNCPLAEAAWITESAKTAFLEERALSETILPRASKPRAKVRL